MKIKELWNKIRKGVKAGMAAATESNVLTDNRVVSMIEKFKASGKYELMQEGERYYQADNDIKNRKITRKVDGHKEEETWRANNKLAHAKYKIQVDEKIAYLLTKPVTYKTDGTDKNDTYVEKVKDVLGKHFQYQLTQLGYEASNKGIGWLHVYLDPEGELKTIVIPAEQCIPYWSDRSHTELDAMIRVYNTTVWQYNQEKEITNVEIWTKDGVKYYRLEGQMLVYDNDKSMDAGGPVAHYKSVEEWKTWGKVPFIPFKNNQIEMPDIKFVKSLIDGYDLGRSEAANYMDEVKNLIFVLKGYGGQNLSAFIKQLNEDRAILIDDAEDGGVDTLTPQMDITALREHYEQLNRDIVESGQSVNKDLDKFGSAPSGVALKFMYSSLDLKCNLMETEFSRGFELLLYFVDLYLQISGHGYYEKIDVELVFNRDMAINEAEQIQNCSNSQGIISDETLIAHHPFVSDVEEELEALKRQQKVLELLSQSSDAQISEVQTLQDEILAIQQNAANEKRQLKEQEIADIQNYNEQIRQIELEALGGTEQEILYAKNEFAARVRTMDLESASELLQEKAKIRDDEIVQIQAAYDTEIQLLQSKLSTCKEEDRAYYEEQIANLEQDKQKKITEQRDLYDEYLSIIEEYNPKLLDGISDLNGQILTGEEERNAEYLQKVQERYAGLEQITESGCYTLYNMEKGTNEDIVVNYDQATGKIVGLYHEASSTLVGYSKEIQGATVEMALNGKGSFEMLGTSLDGLKEKNGELVNANGDVVSSLSDIKKSADGTREGIAILNGTPCEVKVNKDGTIANLRAIDEEANNATRARTLSITLATNAITSGINAAISAAQGYSHYNGLDNVPYDGYQAVLHKGERVLTAEENKAYSNDPGIDYNKMEKCMKSAVRELTLSVGSRELGRIIDEHLRERGIL